MRFLSLSGGGYQGLYTALSLANAEDAFGPLRDTFEGFAGTSVGAIIAAAASVGLPMRDIAQKFEEEGVKIFSDRPPPIGARAVLMDVMRYFNHAKYDGRHLGVIVRSYCRDMRMRDLDRPLLITAVRLRDGAPILFTRETHPDVLLREAVLASAAAPMIFPPVAVNGELHADGAIFANCPDALALDYAINSLSVSRKDVRILGVGAMNTSPPLTEPKDANMGARAWMSQQRIFRTLISAQTGIAERTVSHVLGDRYVRVDADPIDFGEGRIGLDVATVAARETIRQAVESSTPRMVSAMSAFQAIPCLDAIG